MEIDCSPQTKNHYTLKNVRLETGFIEDGTKIKGTQTELSCVEVKDGKIEKFFPNDKQLTNAIDAKGMLVLPAFKDLHVHLDQTLYGQSGNRNRTYCNG